MSAAATTTTARIGTHRTALGTYVGVVWFGNTVIADCRHEHTNRDVSTKANGTSASDCMRQTLKAIVNEATRESIADGYRNAWMRLARGGFSAPTSTIDKAKAAGVKEADDFLTRVDRVRNDLAHLGITVTLTNNGSAVLRNAA